jgi:sterol desaturase/sphingolipid hydroxylase (fatty acid hydroxylase superfamily)
VLGSSRSASGEQVSFLAAFSAKVWVWASTLTFVFVVLWGVERLFPKDRPSEAIQLASLRFWLFYALGGAFFAASFDHVAAQLDLSPLVLISLTGHMTRLTASLVAPVLGLIIYDFFNYWMHRAQHRWFWRQHAIHHSIRNLSAVNSYMHWTEELFRVIFISVPTATLLNLSPAEITLAAAILNAAYGNFIHSASTLHFGKTGRLLLADNRWHRIHHSVEPTHFDRNFGTACTLWDRLFRTAYFPENHEWPETGVTDQGEPQTLDDYLWRPFRQSGRVDTAFIG